MQPFFAKCWLSIFFWEKCLLWEHFLWTPLLKHCQPFSTRQRLGNKNVHLPMVIEEVQQQEVSSQMLQGYWTSKAGLLDEMGAHRGGNMIGVKKANQTFSDFGLLNGARNAGGPRTKVHFSPEIAITTLRPNLFLWSKSHFMSYTVNDSSLGGCCWWGIPAAKAGAPRLDCEVAPCGSRVQGLCS